MVTLINLMLIVANYTTQSLKCLLNDFNTLWKNVT